MEEIISMVEGAVGGILGITITLLAWRWLDRKKRAVAAATSKRYAILREYTFAYGAHQRLCARGASKEEMDASNRRLCALKEACDQALRNLEKAKKKLEL